MNFDEKSMVALDAHFKRWQEIAEQVRIQAAPALKQWHAIANLVTAQVAPTLKMQEAIRVSMEPMIEAHKAFQEASQLILAEAKTWAKAFESIAIPRFEFTGIDYVTRQAGEIQKHLLSPAFEQLQESFRELPHRTQEALLLLGAHGWYLDLQMSMPELWELKKALSEDDVEEAEETLANYFEGRLDEIEKSITERFPHRAHLIRSAFNAHRRQEYELSVPVLLAQTDGMCKEMVHQHLFLKRHKKPRTAIYVEQVAADTFRAALLSPLARTLPISASEDERPEGADALNRHTVLHGESLDYGNKINSLKAISLINYVAQVLKVENNGPNRTLQERRTV